MSRGLFGQVYQNADVEGFYAEVTYEFFSVELPKANLDLTTAN